MISLRNEDARAGLRSIRSMILAALVVTVMVQQIDAACAAVGERISKMPIGVEDAIETTRFVVNEEREIRGNESTPAVLASPSGKRYVIALIHGDVKRDGVWMDIVAGELESSKKVRVITNLFTRGFEYQPRKRYLLDAVANPLVWIDESHVALRWEDAANISQIVSINVDTRELKYLTHHSTDIVFFYAGPKGKIFFAAVAPAGDEHLIAGPYGGKYITSVDGVTLADGHLGDRGSLARIYDRETFVLDNETSTETKLEIGLRSPSFGLNVLPVWSHDGRYVIIDAFAKRPTEQWVRSATQGGNSDLVRIVREALENPDGWYGRQITQLYVVDTIDGSATPLWDAPTPPSGKNPIKGDWSPDGRRVVIGPAWIPHAQSAEETSGEYLAVVEVDLGSGRTSILPLDASMQKKVVSLNWISDDTVAVMTDTEALRFEKVRGEWQPGTRTSLIPREGRGVHMEISEDSNRPPKLYAVSDHDGHKRLLLDPNPDLLRKFNLGRVETWLWSTPDAHEPRTGLLYYPANYKAGRRYPLVIQVTGNGVRFEQFNLYGSGAGLGPSQSMYAAQQLASAGIAVLCVTRVAGSPDDEVQKNNQAFEAAIQSLGDSGLIDPTRVGIVGESRPGWLVTQAITQSDFIYTAAIVSDALDTGYVDGTLFPGNGDLENGGPPVGVALKGWLERSAGFNANRIRTPLRLEDESAPGGGLLLAWELFSRLRRLKQPVEYFVIPDVERGSHILENPHQIIAVKRGAIDWLRFWLADYEDPDPLKAEQYERWHRLRDQRDAALRTPRPPRLQWAATPVQQQP